MSLLQERSLHPLQTSHRAMRAAGGLWVAMGKPDPAALVAEVRSRGVRALEVQQRDLSFLAELPELEFLVVASDPVDVTPVQTLGRLRLLAFSGTWGGRLDVAAFPRLEWLSVVECPRDGGGIESAFAGHDQLRDIAIGRYPWPDLTPLARLMLRRLAISDSRRLASLDGAAALAPTLRGLDLWRCPSLASLAGLEALSDLEVLVLGSLRHVTDLSFVAAQKRLRALDVLELKAVQSLGPLAGHPTLECVIFGRTVDLDLSPLDSLPRLRLVHTGRYRWNRDMHAFPYRFDLAPDDPAVTDCDSLKLG